MSDLRIVGGNLALDFVNTRSGPRHGPADFEWLSSYADFAAWSRRAGLGGDVAGAQVAGAQVAGAGQPGAEDDGAAASGPAAVAAFARVQACRDDMYETFLALADGMAPPAAVLRRMQLAYLEALAAGQLTGDADGFAWHWDPAGGLLAPLWPIVAAAMELLTHGPADHVKPCQACRFLFIDQSKNGSRRWCSMDDCGKTAKIARYLQRRSDARTSSPVT